MTRNSGICEVGVFERDVRKNGSKEVFKEIMANNFQNW